MSGATHFGHRNGDELHVTVISPWPGSPGNRKKAYEVAESMKQPGEMLELVEEAGNEYRFIASTATWRLVVCLDVVPDDLSGQADALIAQCDSSEEAHALWTHTRAIIGFMAHKGKMKDPEGAYTMYIEERVANGEWVRVHG